MKLDNDKYYVGKSSNYISRIGEHIIGNKSASWTKMYKPLKILDVQTVEDDLEEDFTTIKYMRKYGIDNVRGGSFCELNLRECDIMTLTKILKGSCDMCYFCGETDHFINTCPHKNMIRQNNNHKNNNKYMSKSKYKEHKILKYYEGTQLVDNSNIMIDMKTSDDNEKKTNQQYYCKYCNKTCKTRKDKKDHEAIFCKHNTLNNIMNEKVDDIINRYK